MYFYRKFLQFILPILLLPAILQSCSSDDVTNRRKELLSMVNDDALLVVSADPSAILKSVGAEVKGNSIVPSKELERMASRNNDAADFLVELSNAKGIDYHNFVVSVNAESTYALFCLSDPVDFASWIEGKGFNKNQSGEYDVFTNDGLSIAVKGDIAMISTRENNAPEAVATQAAAIVDKAKANPLEEWKTTNLIPADIDLFCNLEGIAAALKSLGIPNVPTDYYAEDCKYATSHLIFNGPTLKINGESYDADGHKTPMLEKGTYSPIPTETLALIKDYQLAWAFSVPVSFSKMMTQIYSQPQFGNMIPAENLKYMGDILNAINWVAMGISSKDGANILNFSYSDLSAVFAANYDKAALEPYISEIVKTMNVSEEDMAIAKTINDSILDGNIHSISFDEYTPGLCVYYKADGDNAIIATDEATITQHPGRLDIPRYVLSYGAINLPKTHPLLALGNCPFGIDIEGYAYEDSYEAQINLTDCEGGFIANILSYISKF